MSPEIYVSQLIDHEGLVHFEAKTFSRKLAKCKVYWTCGLSLSLNYWCLMFVADLNSITSQLSNLYCSHLSEKLREKRVKDLKTTCNRKLSGMFNSIWRQYEHKKCTCQIEWSKQLKCSRKPFSYLTNLLVCNCLAVADTRSEKPHSNTCFRWLECALAGNPILSDDVYARLLYHVKNESNFSFPIWQDPYPGKFTQCWQAT